MDVQFLLMNTLTITAGKVQSVINKFLGSDTFSSIFCFTETKVDILDFKPVGVKIFTKHRSKKEKKGGGLMIGFKEDKKIAMEEIETISNDILAIEGKVRGCKVRIILIYMDSTKKLNGPDFIRNKKIRIQAENFLKWIQMSL